MSKIKPKNYYIDVLQNPDYHLTGEMPVFEKVITPAHPIEQMQEVEQQLNIALDALAEISKSAVKSEDAKIAEKAIELIGEKANEIVRNFK